MQSARASIAKWPIEFNPPDCNGVTCSKVVGGIRGYVYRSQTTDGLSTGNSIEGH